MSTTMFSQLPVGARFEFRGRRYEKLAASFAGDEERCGNLFQAETQVVCLALPAKATTPPRKQFASNGRRFAVRPAPAATAVSL